MENKIIHIVSDEKVVDRTIDYFETTYPGRNTFILLVPYENYSCKYVKKLDKVEVVSIRSKQVKYWYERCTCYEHMLIHMLDKLKIQFVKNINHPNITWIIWGADLYDDLLVPRGYQLYYDSQLPLKAHLISKLRQNFGFIANILDKRRLSCRIKTIKKIKNVAAIEADYQLLMEYYPEFRHLRRKDFFYYPIDEILGREMIDKYCHGSNIMLGNSSSPNGNHLFALQILKNIKCEDKIIIPLSYGNINYRQYLIGKCRQMDTLNIQPIFDYMSLKEYNKILLKCENFIYANLRQEAVGNILIALYLGGKIFLDRRNPLYNYFKDLGLTVFSLEDVTIERLTSKLSYEDGQRNRKIIISRYNHRALIETIRDNFSLS